MTDLEKTKALFDEWGLKYKESPQTQWPTGKPMTTITTGFIGPRSECPKVTGYGDYHVEFDFNDEGQFMGIGVWE